jgi:molybdopterin-guanine dinucleotide biosynthesis protein A
VAVSADPDSPAGKLALSLDRQVFSDNLVHPPGPLNAITGALVWAEEIHRTHLATLPCDTPFVTSAEMFALRRGAYAVTPDGPQALCAVWPVSAWNTLIGYMGNGVHPPVREALEAAGVRPVYFEDASPFANVNTPDDLAALEARLKGVGQ